MNKEELLKMNLQYFAEEDSGQDEGGQEQDEGGEEDLNLPKTQSELDALVNKANQTAIKNATKNMVPKEDLDTIIDEKLSEAEKLKNMTDEEKEDHEVSKLQKKIEEYERKENIQEMSKVAQETLTEQGITEFNDFLGFVVTEEAETTKERVSAFAKAIEARDEKIKEEFQKQLGTRTVLEGNSTGKLSLGEQLAQQANEQVKQPDNDPWKTN